MAKKPVLLCIMDGFGWVPNETFGNAVVAAKTPHLDALMAKYPMTTIDASGMAVGLPDGQMGNSEVGHTNMGAGRIVYQELTRITKEIPYRTARFLSFIFLVHSSSVLLSCPFVSCSQVETGKGVKKNTGIYFSLCI